MVFGADGQLLYRAAQFDEELFVVDVPVGDKEIPAVPSTPVVGKRLVSVSVPEPTPAPRLSDDAAIYKALVTGLRGYVKKNGFVEVVIGSSGGIDSALAATVAVDALGRDAVHTITMPTRYSSQGSVSDSEKLASNLGCRFDVISIESTFESFLGTLGPLFAGTEPNVAEENLLSLIHI